MASDAAIPVSRTASADEVLEVVAAALRDGLPVVLATVLSRVGSTPATPGQKLALLGDGRALGTVGGGALERAVLGQMADLLGMASADLLRRRIDLQAELGMSCGGSVELLLEPLGASGRVLIVGAGHVGSALAPLLVTLGFRVVLCDGRASVTSAASIQTGSQLQLLTASHDDAKVIAALGEGPEHCAALVMTHDHELDAQVLAWAVRSRFAFVGGVGSRRKATRLSEHFARAGLGDAAAQAVRMPLGLDVGARSPAEIAVAIAAELIAWRRGGEAASAARTTGARPSGETSS